MPWKPRSVNDKKTPYDARWQRIRNQTLSGEPLCRICLAAGRTVPATVVDHIVPLQDGGTHARDNLQPLCKTCHDSIKTPADAKAHEARDRTELRLRCVSLGADLMPGLDLRSIRTTAARRMGWQQAHAFMLAAADGIMLARQAGNLPAVALQIVTDDASWTKQASTRWSLPADIDPLQELTSATGTEGQWLRERWSTEYGHRHAKNTQGPQQRHPDLRGRGD